MDGDAPLVSVITATYNWSSVLRYALLSAQAQTFANFELLIIGDGCTDDSAEVVASLRDPRFRWENLPVNHGHQSVANNRGLALARGKWIAYLGHDDLWMPNHLEVLVGELEKTSSDVASSLVMGVGAPGCDGRKLLGAFENGRYSRGAHVPPTGLIHRKSLITESENWPDYRVTPDPPETVLLTRFFDHGAKFIALSEITAFKFPSSWRSGSYAHRSCDEQANFFARMQGEPDFLHRELIELALAQELLKPHTRLLAPAREDCRLPGALIENSRRNRGLTGHPPEEGSPRYLPSPKIWSLVERLCEEELRHRQTKRFTVLELFYAHDGTYTNLRHTRTIVPLGRWTELRIPLEHPSEGAPLRIDPCDRPALIEIAWVKLSLNGLVEWNAEGRALAGLTFGGDAVGTASGETLTVQSLGPDPIIFLSPEVAACPPQILEVRLRISPADL